MGRVSTWRNGRWRRSSERLLVCSRRFFFNVITLNREFNFRAERRIIPFSTEVHWWLQVNLVQIWRMHKKNECMTIGMSTRTEICQTRGPGFTRFTLLNETPPKGCKWSGRRWTNIQMTSRPDHFWTEAWIRIEKLLCHAKEEIQLYWYCRRRTEFCIVLELCARIRSDVKISRKLFT